MGFLSEILQTLLAMIIIAVFAFGGIMLGKVLNSKFGKKKEKKN